MADPLAAAGKIASRGASHSTIATTTSAMKAFAAFLEYQHNLDESWPTTVEALSEDQANDRSMFERYAHWLEYEFVSSAGKDLAFGSQADYLRAVGQELMRQHPTPGNTLSELATPLNWMTKLVDNVQRLHIQRAFEEGGMVRARQPCCQLFISLISRSYLRRRHHLRRFPPRRIQCTARR